MIPGIFALAPLQVIIEIIERIRFPTAICIMAGMVSLLYFHKLTTKERFIVLVIFFKYCRRPYCKLYWASKKNGGDVYNLFCPTEKIIIMVIYYLNSKITSVKQFNILGIIAFILISIGGYYFETVSGYIHIEVLVISGIITVGLSYLHLRQIVLDKAFSSTPIFFFGMANLIYYTLMVSSMSAIPVAYNISKPFAIQISIGNDIAYVLWSLTTLIGIIWNRTKI